MLHHDKPSTSSSPYGKKAFHKKDEKSYNQEGFTIFKAIETVSSLYCTYFIYEFFVHEDTLSIIYISWPVFSILDVVVILDRLFNFKRETNVLVFEIATCFLGYITHTLCAIFLMYILNQEKPVHYDKQGSVLDPKFLRYIKPAVTSTTIACIYLMDCLLSADSLLNIWGIQTWSWPDEPNMHVDLKPSTPLRFVVPWHSSLAKESVIVKIKQIRNSMKNEGNSRQSVTSKSSVGSDVKISG